MLFSFSRSLVSGIKADETQCTHVKRVGKKRFQLVIFKFLHERKIRVQQDKARA